MNPRHKTPFRGSVLPLANWRPLWQSCQCLRDRSIFTAFKSPCQVSRHPAPTSDSRGAKILRKGWIGAKNRKARSPRARGDGSWPAPITARNSKRFHDNRPVGGFGFLLSKKGE